MAEDSADGASRASTANLGNRVRELRSARGWSLKRLSEHALVSQSMLSQIERGEANPTVAIALGIANALGVTVDELLSSGPPRSPIEVVRAGDPRFIYRSDSDCNIRTLSPLRPDRSVELYEITLSKGAELRSAPHFQGTVEYLTVRIGSVRVEAGGHSIELHKGDSAEYPADVPHAIVNLKATEAVLYLVDTNIRS